MGLLITHISFTNFRSYKSFDLDHIGPLTIFVGPNAVGKTNIIEGIQLLSAQTSFRHPRAEELVLEGQRTAHIQMDIEDGKRQNCLEMNIEEEKRKFYLNGKAKRPADLKGLIPSVTFTPDDLELAKGSMSIRRSALDALGSQLSSNHYLIKRDYEKTLRQKNRILKDEGDKLLLDSINETLITCGAYLAAYRAALFEKLAQYMNKYYASITNQQEELYACYIPSWEKHDPTSMVSYTFSRDEAREHMTDQLELRTADERERKCALVGPHADKIEFFVNGRNASLYASQGQQRSIVLSFKLAEVALIQDILHQKPVLLLDDVMSELDEDRRHALVSFIAGDIQTFITTANINYFDNDLLSEACVVQLPALKENE